MPPWVWKLNATGIVAVANMLCIDLCLAVYLLLFGTDGPISGWEPQWKLDVLSVLQWPLVVLTFPIGWFDLFFPRIDSAPTLVPLFTVPLNAYFWGGIVTLIRCCKAKRNIEAAAQK
ncbi:MAG: hypothetical protein K8U03_16290 [Planctomycetia bacterium]|nr:hypothetical protein [Planctomycetia bacterium]